MDTIKIWYVDFWKNFKPESFIFTELLRKKYNVVFDKKKPDIVFCSHFGTDYLEYKCVRILFLGEAVVPNFNVYDYAMGFDDLQYGDRYLKYPFYLLNRKILNGALNKHTYSDEYYLSKKKFCNQVVSNSSGNEMRDLYFDALSKYKTVDSGGRYRNNLPDGKPVDSKEEFQKEYKFSLAFENSAYPGYITEKIIDAWAANTMPIYWGDPKAGEEFNKDSFIDCSNCSTVEEMVETVMKIDKDDDLYLKMMKTPVFSESKEKFVKNSENIMAEFLYAIIDQGISNAYRRNSYFFKEAKAYEKNLIMRRKIEGLKFAGMAKKIVKR